MTKFHSTVSRRDFMKGLGLAGAGLGAASLISPNFHDLDEAASSTLAVHNYPWWVKMQDQPTVEIDWQAMKPYDAREHTFNPHGASLFAEAVGGASIVKIWNDDKAARQKQARQEKKPNYTVEALALSSGIRDWGNFTETGYEGFLGNEGVLTPEDYEIPKWQGTAEENTKILRAACRYVGAAEISIVEIDPATTKKLIYSFEFNDNKAYEFEDVDQPYVTDTKRVIPNRFKYIISTTCFRGFEAVKRWDSDNRYPHGRRVQIGIQAFLRGLGYRGIGPYRYTNNMTANVGLAVMGGMGELGRHQQLLQPVHGALMFVGSSIITDLPLVPTESIDAGMHKFCYTCKRCAEYCPGEALSMETEPYWDVKGPWNHSGYRHWFWMAGQCFPFSDIEPCNGSGCLKNCVFAKRDDANIHNIVKAVSATTPLFNGFFDQMDRMFAYDEARWMDGFWDLDLPIYAWDTTKGVKGF